MSSCGASPAPCSERAGSEPAEATQVADHLVDANLRGHDSHGVGMIPHYVHNITNETASPNTGVDRDARRRAR